MYKSLSSLISDCTDYNKDTDIPLSLLTEKANNDNLKWISMPTGYLNRICEFLCFVGSNQPKEMPCYS